MICYRDMTFCETNGCGRPDCGYLLTDEVRRQARQWWGDGAPIAVGPCEHPASSKGTVG